MEPRFEGCGDKVRIPLLIGLTGSLTLIMRGIGPDNGTSRQDS